MFGVAWLVQVFWVRIFFVGEEIDERGGLQGRQEFFLKNRAKRQPPRV